MKIRNLSLLLGVMLTTTIVQAQTADEIIEKHIAATGGREKLAAITSVRMNNTMQIMGNDAPSTTVVVNGKGFRSETDFNGQQMIQVITDKGGWAVNPMMGSTDPQPMPEAQYKASQEQIYIVPFLDYKTRGGSAELLGQEKVGSVNAYKVKLTGSDKSSTIFYFDPSTYYILQAVRTAEMMGQQMDIITTMSDYRKTDYGWVVPHAVELNFGNQFAMTGKVNKVEVNAPVDMAIFQMKK